MAFLLAPQLFICETHAKLRVFFSCRGSGDGLGHFSSAFITGTSTKIAQTGICELPLNALHCPGKSSGQEHGARAFVIEWGSGPGSHRAESQWAKPRLPG